MSISEESEQSSLLSPLQNTPVGKLDDDILHQIFLLLAFDAHGSGLRALGKLTLKSRTSWIAVTHSCRRWRELALASPRLWTNIIIERDCCRPMLQEFLKRSKFVTLHVSIEGPLQKEETPEHLREIAEVVAPHSDRITAFSITKLKQRQVIPILSPFVFPARELQALTITSEQRLSLPLIIPALFGNETPALSSIAVSNISLAWRPLRNMKCIILKDQPVTSMEQLMSTLRDCPALSVLCLGLRGFEAPKDFAVALNETLTLDLPHLTHLVLSGHHDTVASLLSRLKFPLSARLGFSFGGKPTRRMNYTERCHVLQNATYGINKAVIELTEIAPLSSLRIWSESTPFTAQWYWASRGGVFDGDEAQFSHFGDVMTFHGLHQLTIKNPALELGQSDWLTILSQMPRMKMLRLEEWGTRGVALFEALGTSTTDRGSPSAITLPCPYLSDLQVSVFIGPVALAIPLALTLQKRAALGIRLHHFEITFKDETTPSTVTDSFNGTADLVHVHFGRKAAETHD